MIVPPDLWRHKNRSSITHMKPDMGTAMRKVTDIFPRLVVRLAEVIIQLAEAGGKPNGVSFFQIVKCGRHVEKIDLQRTRHRRSNPRPLETQQAHQPDMPNLAGAARLKVSLQILKK